MEKLRNTAIDRTNIDEELSMQPARFLFVAEKFVGAEILVTQYTEHMDRLHASLDKEVRAKLNAEGTKFTEKMVENAVKLDSSYAKAQAHMGNLKAQRDALKALKDSWVMRKDCLIELARKDRDEMRSVLSRNKEVQLGQ